MFKLVYILFLCVTFLLSAEYSQKNTDTDNDLVPDYEDRCPNTPEGVFVTKYGCTKPIYRNIYFDHGSAYIGDKYKKIILKTSLLINEVKGYKVIVSGHTDSIADAKTNMKLSYRRAKAVEDMLIKNKVDKNRIVLSWHGESMPVASNITSLGRSKNRRVNIILK
ncbi:MAG: hypothetical protein CSA86_05210 [Arcobacter sp.]|nr:MAG: hypothetical protein CSA86_05210 [Arcobacter sp.]